MAARFFAVYRCRLCGAIVEGPFFNPDAEHELEDMMKKAADPDLPKSKPHICDEDHIGIADHIGFYRQK